MRIVQARALDGRKLPSGDRLHGWHGTGNGFEPAPESFAVARLLNAAFTIP